MYEIWLVMNIVWEIALDAWPAVAAAAAAWALLVLAASRRARPWRRVRSPALAVGAAAALAAVLVLPALTRSSLDELAYWVDWINLLAIAGGFGALVLAFAWPLLALRGGVAAGSSRPAPAARAAGGGAPTILR